MAEQYLKPSSYFLYHEQLRGYEIYFNGVKLNKAEVYHNYPSMRERIAQRLHSEFEFKDKSGWKDGKLIAVMDSEEDVRHAELEKRVERELENYSQFKVIGSDDSMDCQS